uniref:Uncharacterized protein n=1 Tax=Strix occidentalis caurina TaxID=311401 RepID=A0A8D0KV47_STROC
SRGKTHKAYILKTDQIMSCIPKNFQMCYASLDHSVKGKRRKPRRKKNPSLQEDGEERSSTTTTMASKVSIYLNSEQLAAENTANVEAVHDDPIRLMGLICIQEPTKILANDL